MSDILETLIITIAVGLVFVFGVATGYSCGTKGMDELKAEKAVVQFTRLSEDLKEAVVQRDECRRIVREWAAPARPAKK